jgi:hypothetical protein
MPKIHYICNSLPSSITSGSDYIALNMLKELKKKYPVTAISIGTNYCKESELIKIHKELKKLKINFYEINSKNFFKKNSITLKNFFSKNYIEIKNVEKAKKFLKIIKFHKNDIIFAFGSASIISCKNINCIKIALFEDLQDQVFYYRTLLSINKLNFLKKILKIILLKIHFRGYLNWLYTISSNYNIFYTFSLFDYQFLKKKIKVKLLALPMVRSINKLKVKLNKNNKKFNISMLSTSISQDYEGVKLMDKYLLPGIEKENLFNKIKINLIMRVPKKVPDIIKKIINNKKINIVKYSKEIIRDTDLLFYPSKYPVGIRTKILFAFSKSWIVATSTNTKKNIPYLIDKINCLLSNNTSKLVSKIIHAIKYKSTYYNLRKKGTEVLKNYTFDKFSNQIYRDIKIYDEINR